MAARVTPDMPLFPQTYNEDWIFVFWALLKNAAAVAHLGTLVQEPRNPFLVHNSAYQFFGNILAPGLFRAVDIGRKNQQDPLWIIRQRAFWQEHVRHRVNFLDDLYTQLERFVNQSESSDPRIIQEISDISGILAAVDAETLPDQLLEYATKLINDMDRWRTWLAGLDCIESGDDFEPALRQLVVN